MQITAKMTTCATARPNIKNCMQAAALASVVLLASCSDSDPEVPGSTPENTVTQNPDNPGIDPNPEGPSDEQAIQARYRLSFDASWSAQSHPLNFPGNPHFSGLVGAVHNEQIRFWEPAQIATPGIQLMAETGAKSILLSEVQAAIDAGSALSPIDGGGVRTSPGAASIEFTVTRDYPEVTVTSMLAPSPDWFVGLHNFSLLEDGEFITSRTINLELYDSGSDDGVRYTSPNEASDPLAPVARVSSDSQDAPFIDGLPSVGTFTIQQIPLP